MAIFTISLSKFVLDTFTMRAEIIEDWITPESHWSEDKEFVAELHDRVRRYEAGIDPGLSIEGARATLNAMKEEYRKSSKN